MRLVPDPFKNRPYLPVAALAAAGLLLRVVHIVMTRQDPPHPDLGGFLAPALALTHPFDTSPREPFFVWWLWLVAKTAGSSFMAIRLATAAWFLPSLWLTHRVAGRFLGGRGALAVAALYAFLPAQVQGDSVGLRHLLEGFGVLCLLDALTAPDETPPLTALAASVAANALLTLTRVNFAASATALTLWGAVRRRRPWLAAAVLPGLLLLLFHLRDNSVKHGDPLHSVNLHTYWFANLEYIGQPGFAASMEEWREDTHKPSLTYREWAWGRHGAWGYAKETVVGVFRCLWIFPERVYFEMGLPRALKWTLLTLYAAGLVLAAVRARLRFLLAALVILILPYAFISHVFWAGRFFVPFAAVMLTLLVAAAAEIEKTVRTLLAGRFPGKLPPPFLAESPVPPQPR